MLTIVLQGTMEGEWRRGRKKLELINGVKSGGYIPTKKLPRTKELETKMTNGTCQTTEHHLMMNNKSFTTSYSN